MAEYSQHRKTRPRARQISIITGCVLPASSGLCMKDRAQAPQDSGPRTTRTRRDDFLRIVIRSILFLSTIFSENGTHFSGSCSSAVSVR